MNSALPCADDSQGSIGFVLNRPSALRLSDVAAAGRSSPVAGVADVFGGSRLRVGGPVHPETLTALHGYGGCAGAQKIVEVRFGEGLGHSHYCLGQAASPRPPPPATWVSC
jgi:putative AlgH/UPF0301 family transcriptional regulator